ncbi:MAG TPA: glycosyltransferase family 4 protein [Sphingomicrobium sp.]|nr:glycosyltransferase family 4 protein [Sphingomicrobium sp.]
MAPVRSDFLFVGNFVHPPNADAARRLVNSIFPMIQRDLPKSKLAIVGPNAPTDVLAAHSDDVNVTGWVDDPAIYLAGAAVVLVPLRQGGGLRVKILEACAAGKAIVASPTAVEGLSLRHGEQAIIADTDEEFARSAVALIEDPETRTRLELASRRWWEEEQDSAPWSAEYAELYATLLGTRARTTERKAALA